MQTAVIQSDHSVRSFIHSFSLSVCLSTIYEANTRRSLVLQTPQRQSAAVAAGSRQEAFFYSTLSSTLHLVSKPALFPHAVQSSPLFVVEPLHMTVTIFRFT